MVLRLVLDIPHDGPRWRPAHAGCPIQGREATLSGGFRVCSPGGSLFVPIFATLPKRRSRG